MCCISRTRDGGETGWKILKRGPEATEQPKNRLFVENGQLYFSTGLTRWLKKRRMRAPEMLVSWSGEAGALRVRDMDGQTRYYSWPQGEYLGQEEIQGTDWQWIPMTPEGRWEAGGKLFRLADPVFQKGHQRLICRYIPDKGFFLWWRQMPFKLNSDPRPMHLPMRADMKDSTPPVWLDLNKGGLP